MKTTDFQEFCCKGSRGTGNGVVTRDDHGIKGVISEFYMMMKIIHHTLLVGM